METKDKVETGTVVDIDGVKEHWETATPGIRYSSSPEAVEFYNEVRTARYELEPFIKSFAGFDSAKGLDVLEIGVGAGADFANWVMSGANATGIDLTDAAVEHTRTHMESLDVDADQYELQRANAEELPFPDNSFDVVFSWGVLHHSPNTAGALAEVLRVLKPGGRMKIMVYSKYSWSAWMMWGMHGLLKGKPWKSPKTCLLENMQGRSAKSYSIGEAQELVAGEGFEDVRISTVLGPGDLLTIKPSQRYGSLLSRIAFAVYPRWLVRALGDRFGLYMMISGDKS